MACHLAPTVSLACLVFLACLAFARGSYAQALSRGDPSQANPGSVSGYRLIVVPSECLSQIDFERDVAVRLPHVTTSPYDAASAVFRVSAVRAPNGSGFVGYAEIERPGQLRRVRRVEGRFCRDVLDALALVVAVTVDAARHDKGMPSKSRSSRPSEMALGFSLGLASTLSGSGALFGALGLRGALELSRLVVPELRLQAVYSETSEQIEGGRLELSLQTIRVRFSPVDLLAAVQTRLGPALYYELGRLSWQGRGFTQDHAGRELWQAAGLGLPFASCPHPSWCAEASAGLLLPFYNHRFFVARSRAVEQPEHQLDQAGFWLELGLAYSFL